MWLNYLKICLRAFLGNKLFSFINLFGLAVGLASAVLIGLYVADDLGYDRFHPNADRLYRISRDFHSAEGSESRMATLPPPAMGVLLEDYPEIEAAARIRQYAGLLRREEQAFQENALLYADPAVFELFRFEWLAGDAGSALATPNSIVLTESLARKYFGAEPALGQRLQLENLLDLTVTGVIRDLPPNTHLEAGAFLSLELLLSILPEPTRSGWTANIMHTYVRLAPGADMAAMAATFPDFVNRRIGPDEGRYSSLSAMKVSDIHLHSTHQNEMREPGSMAVVMSLTAVALGIVLIACFNFMNLSTARSALRGKEVGIRKTIGAQRKHLILQFLGESLGMAALATLIAVVLVELLLPAFNGFLGRTLAFDVLGDADLQMALAVLVLGVGGIAGSYPALYLSAFKPAQVLKNRVALGLRDVVFRNLLVVLQFSISIMLVIATTVVLLQTRYARNLDLGFDKGQVVVLAGSRSFGLTPRWPTLRDELLKNPAVVSVSASDTVPGTANLNSVPTRTQGSAGTRNLPPLTVDYGFFETYGIELLAGRLFGEDFPGDRLPEALSSDMTGNFILNASAAREYGWTPEQAIGQPFEVAGVASWTRGRIVGVVADSNFESARSSVKPLVFMLGQQGQRPYPVFSGASVRIAGGDVQATLAYIDEAWRRVLPDYPVSRRFLSDDYEALYQDDTRLGRMFSSFAVLAILIACLGLFGLATFNAQRRIKEIGIRKVMGGSVWSIVLLLTNDFSKLVLLANLLAWPVAYVAMNRWLENFAYRIDLTPLIFIGSGAIALCIAWVTVGGTAAKAASQKPVLALRYE